MLPFTPLPPFNTGTVGASVLWARCERHEGFYKAPSSPLSGTRKFLSCCCCHSLLFAFLFIPSH